MSRPRKTSWAGELYSPTAPAQQASLSQHYGLLQQPEPLQRTDLMLRLGPDPREHGRHRAHPNPSGAANPAPPPALFAESSDDGRLPEEAQAEEPPEHGLHAFDLGTVPASVTPPRSWRHAAWFAVASSCAALSGLVLATSALTNTSPTSFDGQELPGMPRARPYPPVPASDRYLPDDDPSRPEANRQSSLVRHLARSTETPPLGQTGLAKPQEGAGADVANSESSTGNPSPSPSKSSSQPPTEEAPHLFGASDIDAVEQRSEQYFAAIRAKEWQRAWGMTTGELREEGFATFVRSYADFTSIEVVEVYATPASTMTTLRMTRGNGTVETQQRKLQFASGEDLLIESDQQV